MGQLLTVSGKLNRIGEAKRNRVWIGRIVSGSRPETEWSILGQVEGAVTRGGDKENKKKKQKKKKYVNLKYKNGK